MKKKTRASGARVREEPDAGYAARLKGETSNVQRSTSNVQVRGEKAESSSEKRYDLEERLLDYAVRIIRLVDALPATRAGRHVADQLLRCGTSPLANHGELQGAESRKDFIHKLGLCLKEIRETRRWLRLVHRVPLLVPAKVEPLLAETEALIKIFSASIRTAKRNRR
jgi:four helix bundle protein